MCILVAYHVGRDYAWHSLLTFVGYRGGNWFPARQGWKARYYA